MTDNKMTAEQALAVKALGDLISKALRAGYEQGMQDTYDQNYSPDHVDENYLGEFIAECDEIEVLRAALSAPRVPDGWNIERSTKNMVRVFRPDGTSVYAEFSTGDACEVMLFQLCEAMLAASPEPVAAAEKVHAVSLAPEVPGSDNRGVIGHYKIHKNGDREGTVLGNWDWERVVADAGLTGKWMVLHFTDATDFERDWSLLEATQDSLREHSELLKQRESELADLRAEVEALKAKMPDALEPVEGDQLPPVGSKVLIHLGREDEWVEHTVVGYYAWPDLKGATNLHRVFVRVRSDSGSLNVRMLKDVRSVEAARLREGGEDGSY